MHVYEEFSLSEIKANGWLKEYLKAQAAGMTGNLDRVGEPFSGKYWARMTRLFCRYKNVSSAV